MPSVLGLNIGVGESFFTLAERAGAAKGLGLGAGLSSNQIVDAIEDIQSGKIKEVYDRHGGDLAATIRDLYQNANVPNDIETAVGTKIANIVSKMHNAANSAARAGEYVINKKTMEKVSYNTVNGEMIFNKQMKPGTFGSFIQDIMVLGGVVEDLPANSSLADIQGIAEIKETWQSEMLHVGSFTAGMIIDNTQGTEATVREILKRQENIESMAILELYIKMKNLLLIITDPSVESGVSKPSYKSFTFAAIILYVELLIKEIKKLVHEGAKAYVQAQAARSKYYDVDDKGNYTLKADMKVEDYRKELPYMSTPYVKIEPESGNKLTIIDGQPVVQEAFHLTIENLHLEKGDSGYMSTSAMVGGKSARTLSAMEAKIKNLQDLYKTRKDILSYIKGEGRRENAANFYKAITEGLPIFEFGD